MDPKLAEVVLRRFETPDEVRVFEEGKLEIVRIVSLHFMGADQYAK